MLKPVSSLVAPISRMELMLSIKFVTVQVFPTGLLLIRQLQGIMFARRDTSSSLQKDTSGMICEGG
jgi:hypothetical protein